MELFFILTEAMYRSLYQGIVVYLVAKLVLLSFTGLPSSLRYKVLYTAHCLIFFLFCVNLYTIGRQIGSMPADLPAAASVPTASPLRYISIKAVVMSHAPLIGAVYLIGLLTQTVLLVSGWLRMKGFCAGDSVVPAFWNEKLAVWKDRLQISQDVRLVAGTKAAAFTAGFVKPVIYLPVTAFTGLSTAQAEAILLHELAHIRRNDYIFNLIQKGIEAVMFFNPASRALGSEIGKEREFCCDDLVLRYTESPQQYAGALFMLESSRLERLSAGLAATGSANTLLDRIKRITTMNTYRSTVKPGILGLTAIVAIGLSVAWIAPASDTLKVKPASKNILPDVPAAPAPPEAPAVPGKLPRLKVPATAPAPPKAAPALPDTIPPVSDSMSQYFSSPAWKEHMEAVKKHTEELKKHFESAEWKQHMKEMKEHGAELQKHFNSPEWKKQQQMIAKHAEEMKKHFESPEWKKHMAEIQKHGEEMEKQFNSPEWKRKMEEIEKRGEEMEKKFNSPEWKKKMSEIEKRNEEIEKKFNSPEWEKKTEELEASEKDSN
ncbi:MAG TPA: M56 family metallopeptidase [Sphingobacteriaceae bacterium]